MREKGSWSQTTYASRASTVQSQGGNATYEAEERVRQGKGLDSLVDPSQRGVIREANNLLVPEGDIFKLPFGIAMPVETNTDTTASMGQNVDIVFSVQPKVQNLLIQGEAAVLKRYHVQMATGSIGDRGNRFPYQRSQFEPDNEVERQMGLLVPERNGIDLTEDYQLALFAAAYLTKTSIIKYGLKGYYFVIGDERGRDEFDESVLKRVFGPSVYDKAFGQKPAKMPTPADAAKKVMDEWHCFYLQVDNHGYTRDWWTKLWGPERVIKLARTEDVAEVQAVIIGLTEGELDLQSAVEFLKQNGISAASAKSIVDVCAGVPLGLQATYANFGKIPLAGAKFASRDDIWPMDAKGKAKKATPAEEAKKDWKL